MSFRLFEGENHAKAYSRYRPKYPETVFREIVKYCRQNNQGELSQAIDVGCGNGQSTLPLKKHFKQVIGVDISEMQISEARLLSSEIDFRIGPAEDLGFQADESVDLVTVAQAFHWMDANKFYSEATRILKPGGTLVLYGSMSPKFDNDATTILIKEFEFGTLGKYWTTKRHLIDNMYSDVELPFENIHRNNNLSYTKTLQIEEYVGYISTWSAWAAYYKDNPNSPELGIISQRLKEIYTDPITKEQTLMTLTWPVFMLFGSKPFSV